MLKMFEDNKAAKGIAAMFVIAFIFMTVVVVAFSLRERQHAKAKAQIKYQQVR